MLLLCRFDTIINMNNKYDPIDFSKKLIKGRIAETLFEQMLRDTDFLEVRPHNSSLPILTINHY